MKRLGKNLLRVFLVVNLGLVLFPAAEVFAQGEQRQQPIESEPTLQPVDEPREETKREVPEAPKAETVSPDYVIGPEDILNIDVFNVPELSHLVVRVANDGSITLPLLGQVHASGLTTEQLRQKLQTGKWGEVYLQDPQVAVFVQEYHARPVSVIGAVEKPGLYPMTAPRTLIEMLSLAGGLAKRSSAPAGRFVYVTRKSGLEELDPAEGMRLVAPDKVEIDLRRLLFSHEDGLNIEIKPLDIISVSKADIVYVAGNGVRRPGGFILEDRDKVTVLQALAMAEGLAQNAAKSDARLIRTKPDGSKEQIPVDLKKVQKAKSPDIELAANDILFVPDNSQKAALKRALDTTIGTISGMLIFGRF